MFLGKEFWGASQLRLFLKLTHYRLLLDGAFSPWAVALSAPRALPWAGIGARRWRLRLSAGCGFLGSVTTSVFSQTDPLPGITVQKSSYWTCNPSSLQDSFRMADHAEAILRDAERMASEIGAFASRSCSKVPWPISYFPPLRT